MDKPIYLDYAATTPISELVFEKMKPYMAGGIKAVFGNPASSTHCYGWEAKSAVTTSRELMAQLLNITPKELVFTSGATESNNLALLGTAQFYKNKGKHIITCTTEHKAVLDTCYYLETHGYDVSYISPESNGLIDLNKLESMIRKDTILISIMHVNNETGVIQDISKIGEITRQHEIIFHVDAAQSAGKLPLDLSRLNVDLLSISGHKLYGPKGVGALYVNRNPKVNLNAQIHGGGHEYGLRSGTLATHQIVGLAAALEECLANLEQENSRLKKLEDKIFSNLFKLNGIILNGDIKCRKSGHINICIEGVHGDALISSLTNLAVSSGSACNSAVSATSYVLKAMGVPDWLAQSALRISLGKYTTASDIDSLLEQLITVINKLRKISPIALG